MPVLVLLLSAVALLAIVLLQHSSSEAFHAELHLAELRADLTQLQSAPFRASTRTGGSPARAQVAMRTGKAQVASRLAELRRDAPVPALAAVTVPLAQNYAALDRIYAIAASGGDLGARVDRLAGAATLTKDRVDAALAEAGHEYGSRASAADGRATAGSAITVVLLALAFAFFHRRSVRERRSAERLAHENHRLARANGLEARTDALTGLGNRRALLDDLAAETARATPEHPLLLALFDLDGFKQYNDAFGHPAGDALLARLGLRLRVAVGDAGTAYRMGGDEFCVLAPVEAGGGGAIARRAGDALAESGDAFTIRCSRGRALVPTEATASADALRLADQRMYADKAGGSSASRQSTDVLLKVLTERKIALHEQSTAVADMARRTAERLGLPAQEVWRIALAAELLDVGNTAIPDGILNKAGPLDEEEWAFIRRHTIIGERIIRAAPSLAPAAELVRSSHERVDGGGYPDALRADAIPIGARIIAVCDAFDAMVCGRPHQDPLSTEDALEVLRRCAGTQFDHGVLAVFVPLVHEREAVPVVG